MTRIEDGLIGQFLTDRTPFTTREELWQAVQESIRERLGLERFSIWFGQTELMKADQEQLVVGVPNVIIQQFLTAQYTAPVEAAVEELLGRRVRVSFDVAPRLFRQMRAQQQDELSARPSAAGGSPDVRAARPRRQAPRGWGFEHLIACRPNKLPFAAARELAGQRNPRLYFLYVCGDYGLGKTELLHAIYALACGADLGLEPVYVTAENWCNEYYRSIQRKTTHIFRGRYRSCDLLLVDDVQFVQGKAAGQRELLHTVKHMLGKGGRVALCGKPRPEELVEVEPALVALLRTAFPAVLLPPGEDERLDVARQIAVRHRLDAVEEVLRLVAATYGSSFAVMESAICRLALYAGVEGCGKLELAAARDALAVMQPATEGPLTLELIREAVAEAFSVPARELTGRSRRRTACLARQAAIYLSRQLTDHSLAEVGVAFGGLCHSTVKHAADKIASERGKDPRLAAHLERLERRLSRA